MPRKSTNSSAKTKSRSREQILSSQPLSSAILQKAKRIARQYAVVIEPHERLGYRGSVVEMPNLLAFGSTGERCIAETRYVAQGAVAVMLHAGQEPPAPMSEQRTLQLNVRLTPQERLLLESASRRQGFRGVSDFVRNAALAQTRKSA